MVPLANDYVALAAAYGVGVLAVGVGGTAIYATLDAPDRARIRRALRHPLRSLRGGKH